MKVFVIYGLLFVSCMNTEVKTIAQESAKTDVASIPTVVNSEIDTLNFSSLEELDLFYKKVYDSIRKEIFKLKKSGKNEKSEDSLKKVYKERYLRDKQKTLAIFKLIKNSERGLPHFRRLYGIIKSQDIPLREAEKLYLSFPAQIRNKNAIFYKAILDERKLVEDQKNVDPIFFHHSLWNEEKGTFQTLNDVLGDLLIINFWASWCTPCRYKNQFLLENSKEIEDLGYTLVAISLDTDKSKWVEARKKDKISFLDLLDIKGFDSEIAKMLKINEIPFIAIVNKNGKILGINIQELELLNKLKQIAAAYVVNDTKQATTK